jgi:hypothetical protein
MRNRFLDPSTGQSYEWVINHREEEEFGRERDIEVTAPTGRGNIPHIRQQGDDSPLRKTLQGVILDPGQHDAFVLFWNISRFQTIYFRDFTGEESEVLITAYKPTKHGVLRNARGGAVMPNFIYRYTITMDVLRVLTGPWAGVAS